MEVIITALEFIGNNIPLLTILILATFIGQEVIANIPSILHTPLMSGANAISGIVIIGAVIVVLQSNSDDYFKLSLGFFAIASAAINVVGGFVVTDRILGMFKKKKK
jgi:NAD(P) transhydrogenase subunit alpha